MLCKSYKVCTVLYFFPLMCTCTKHWIRFLKINCTTSDVRLLHIISIVESLDVLFTYSTFLNSFFSFFLGRLYLIRVLTLMILCSSGLSLMKFSWNSMTLGTQQSLSVAVFKRAVLWSAGGTVVEECVWRGEGVCVCVCECACVCACVCICHYKNY